MLATYDRNHALEGDQLVAAKKNTTRDRRELLAQMEAERRKSERRRTLAVAAVVGAIVIAIVVGTAIGVRNMQNDREAQAQRANSPIEGVRTFDDLTSEHVDGEVGYPQSPPVGGDHNPVWVNCGSYDEPVSQTSAVHSMEHGAVWVTYQPDLSDDEMSILDEVAGAEDYALVTPYAAQEAPVVATAWGVQLELDDAGDERLRTFLTKYLQGPQTPEPGAPCTGGLGG